MNKRLDLVYKNIEESNKEKILNNELGLDSTWGEDIWGVTLQIDLGSVVKDQMEKFQEELDELEPGNLLLLPRQYQHISFNQVVFWGGEYKLGKEKTWEKIRDEFIEGFKSYDKLLNSFEVRFSKLIATSGGIIWCAYDENDELENMREKLLKELPFPKETTKLNHIIHTTVARYKNKLSNPQSVLDYVKRQRQSVSMKAGEIVLKNELIFPSIKTKDIAKIRLI